MNDYQNRFLKQYVLWQEVKLDDSQTVLRRCIELADKDMLSGGRFISMFFNIKARRNRVEYLLNELKNNE